MKEFTVEKLYRNHASIRDYIVKECITKNEPLMIHYKKETMTVSVETLKEQFQFHQQNFRSKFKQGQSYQLVDFFFFTDQDPEVKQCNS